MSVVFYVNPVAPLSHTPCIDYIDGRPGVVSGYHPRAWYRSVSWVRAPPSSYSYKFVGTFSCAQIDFQNAQERELAAADEKSTSSRIAERYARSKLKARTAGEKGQHLWSRLVQNLESRSVRKKNKVGKNHGFRLEQWPRLFLVVTPQTLRTSIIDVGIQFAVWKMSF